MTPLAVVVRTLDEAGVPCALIGASALSAYAVARSTLDIDLMVCDPKVLDPALWSRVGAGCAVDVRRGDVLDPLVGVVRVTGPGRPVDVVVFRPLGWQAAALARAVPVTWSGLDVRVVTPEDLVLLKLYAGGPADLWDVLALLDAVPDRAALVGRVDASLSTLPAVMRRRWAKARAP
jgi:predicted nucleotidyltransferase